MFDSWQIVNVSVIIDFPVLMQYPDEENRKLSPTVGKNIRTNIFIIIGQNNNLTDIPLSQYMLCTIPESQNTEFINGFNKDRGTANIDATMNAVI